MIKTACREENEAEEKAKKRKQSCCCSCFTRRFAAIVHFIPYPPITFTVPSVLVSTHSSFFSSLLSEKRRRGIQMCGSSTVITVFASCRSACFDSRSFLKNQKRTSIPSRCECCRAWLARSTTQQSPPPPPALPCGNGT